MTSQKSEIGSEPNAKFGTEPNDTDAQPPERQMTEKGVNLQSESI